MEAGSSLGLPVETGMLHQCVSVPVLDDHFAAHASKALGVILVLAGHLQREELAQQDHHCSSLHLDLMGKQQTSGGPLAPSTFPAPIPDPVLTELL